MISDLLNTFKTAQEKLFLCTSAKLSLSKYSLKYTMSQKRSLSEGVVREHVSLKQEINQAKGNSQFRKQDIQHKIVAEENPDRTNSAPGLENNQFKLKEI